MSNPNSVLVNEKQRGNPLLKSVRLCSWEYSKELVPDYVMGTSCAIFISLKYHLLHPRYIEQRLREVDRSYKVRVLLALTDDDNKKSLLELNKLAFVNDFTLILCSSNEECGRYIETFKSYENKNSSSIQEKTETEYLPKLTKTLTSVKPINKTDVLTLIDVFGSFQNICAANEQQLVLCPGIGERKVKRLFQTLNEPFLPSSSSHSNKVSTVAAAATNDNSGNNNSNTKHRRTDQVDGSLVVVSDGNNNGNEEEEEDLPSDNSC